MPSKSVNITMPGMPQVEIHLNGQWVKVTNLINGMPESIRQGYRIGIRKISRQLLIIVRKAIRTHLPPPNSGVRWPPLSKNTLKAHRGGKGRGIYYLTGTYSRIIGVKEYQSRTLIGLPVNISPLKKDGTPKGITYNQLAIILEHGSNLSGGEDGAGGSIPARPLWKPSYKSYGGNQKVKQVLLREIRSSLIRNHGLNNSQIRIT